MNPKAIENIQTVAFIGFDVDLNPGSISQQKNSDQLARLLQNKVKDSFSQELNWHIIQNAKLANNSVYQGFYHQYKSRLLKGGLVEDSQLRDAEASRLSFDEREKLINALNVDAIAMMNISTPVQKEENKNGITTKYFQANINFALYEKGNQDSIWKAYNVQGTSDSALTYPTPKTLSTDPQGKHLATLTLAKMMNGQGIKNSIDQFLSTESTSKLIQRKYQIMQDAIDQSTNNLILELKNKN